MITITFNRECVHHQFHGGFQKRNPSILKLFTDVWKSFSPEEMTMEKKFSVSTEDVPYIHTSTFSIAGKKQDADKCFPCFVFDKWEEANIDDYEDTVEKIRTAAKVPPIHSKAFWIGAATHSTRLKLIEIGSMYPDVLETRLFSWNPSSTENDFVSLPDHTRYRYLIDMQGGGYSGRLKMLLHARRLLFIQDRQFWDWATSTLEPWVHYVPIREDLSDILEKITWADENPEKVARIVSNCDEYAKQRCSRACAYMHIRDLIKSL